jgi:hypothetical protein
VRGELIGGCIAFALGTKDWKEVRKTVIAIARLARAVRLGIDIVSKNREKPVKRTNYINICISLTKSLWLFNDLTGHIVRNEYIL